MKNVLAAAGILVLALVTSLRGSQEEPELKKLKNLKAEPLSVIQVGNEVKVVKKSELANLKKEIEKSYKEAVKEYAKARDQARKAKTQFTSPRPVKGSLTIIAASVKTAEEAEKIRDKALSDYVVVQVNEELKVVRKIEFASFKTRVEADYKLALAKHGEAKQGAKKSRQAFNEPVPAKPKIKVVASGLTSEDAANAKMQELLTKDKKPKARTRKEKEKQKQPEDEDKEEEVEEVGDKEEEIEDEDKEEEVEEVEGVEDEER
jgi:hypothetical protein